MTRLRKRWLALVAAILTGGYACASIQATGAPASPNTDLSFRSPEGSDWSGADVMTLVTWNLGYAGLGRESDFFADGGDRYLPPSRTGVVANRDAIAAWLGASNADVILTQETARASVVNWWVEVKGAVDAALPGYGEAFYADFRTRLLPPPLRIRNGLATYGRGGLADAELWPLPSDGDPYDGPLRRRYAALATRLNGPGGCWTVVNVHTAAFDEGAALRRRQITAVLDRAAAEAAAGRRVIIGGDWNLRLVGTDFPHTSKPEDLFWVHDFPADLLPAGWRVAADPRTPTVRTNERPYAPEQNYTAVIDGFLIGPGVTVEAVEGIDLGFRHSDHQPVRLTVRASGGESPPCP